MYYALRRQEAPSPVSRCRSWGWSTWLARAPLVRLLSPRRPWQTLLPRRWAAQKDQEEKAAKEAEEKALAVVEKAKEVSKEVLAKLSAGKPLSDEERELAMRFYTSGAASSSSSSSKRNRKKRRRKRTRRATRQCRRSWSSYSCRP